MPFTCSFETILGNFLPFSFSPTFWPHAFENGTVFENLSAVTVRLTVLELAFLDSSVVPASTTYAVFLVGYVVNLTIIVICTYPFVFYIESLGYKMIISDMVHGDNWQLFPLFDGGFWNLIWDSAKGQINEIEQILLGQHTYKGFFLVGLNNFRKLWRLLFT